MKQFDDIFKEKVSSAFSNADYSQLADDGWKAFVRKQKGGRKLALVVPFWAKAASVAVLLSVGGLFVYKSFNDKPLAVSENTAPYKESVNPAPEPISESVKTVVPLKNSQLSPEPYEAAEEKPAVNLLTVSDVVPETDSIASVYISQDIPFQSDTVRNNVSVQEENIAENEVVKETKKEVILTEPAAEEVSGGRKTSLIAGFAGIMSEAGSKSASTPGVSVGFFIDQKLGKRISFRPGIALSKFAYASVPVASAKVMDQTYAAVLNNNTPIDNSDNKLDVITMEIPLNFVFTVLEKGKSSLFVSAGASTLVYLNQQFSGDYVGMVTQKSYDAVTGALIESSVPQAFNVKSEDKAFSHTDYFGLANLSAGYSMSLGKSSMLLEPFIQLPVSDLTSFDLKIKYGGLSVKYRFGR